MLFESDFFLNRLLWAFYHVLPLLSPTNNCTRYKTDCNDDSKQLKTVADDSCNCETKHIMVVQTNAND